MQPRLPFDDSRRPAPGAGEASAGAPHLDPHTLPSTPVFVRHPRARRYVIRVTDTGVVRVTIPRWGSRREASAFVVQQRRWIAKQLQRVAESTAPSESVAARTALVARAKRELPPRLLELAAQHALTVTRVSIRNQQWRWGSCSPNGHICLNWRLVTMPAWVRDYVLIHELMHLKRMDHSPKFWTLVASACPEYEAARAWLRDEGRQCLKTRP
jgi:predicted metal-dependent hydrolase